MKKIIFSVLALAALASCVKEQTLNVAGPAAIEFAGTYVENATKSNDPSTTNDNLSEMYVWGIVQDETGIVFNDETVSKSGSEWTYLNTQYWTPGNEYWFSAIAGDRYGNNGDQIVIDYASSDKKGMSKNGLGTVTFTNESGINDILYAEYYLEESPAINEVQQPVKFQFQHLLSKVQFTFKNGFQNNNNTVVVKDIKMVVPKVGTIDLTADELAWTDLSDETLVLDMGTMNNEEHVTIDNKATSDNVRFTIPTPKTHEYAISFIVELYMGDVLAYTTPMESVVKGVALEMGKAYNFTATVDQNSLDLHKIEFNVGVTEWEEYVDVEHPVVANFEGNPYTSLQAAIDAAEKTEGDQTITLISTANENVTITQKEGLNLVIDGNGKTFKGTMRVSGCSRDSQETLTIKNVNFVNDTTEPSLDMYWGSSNETRYAHNVTVQNCTFTMEGAAKHTAVAIDLYQPYNIVVNEVEVTDAASLLQVKGGHKGISVSNVKIIGCKNGLSFGTHDGPVSLTNAEIDVRGYGVRADGSVTTTLTVENAKIKADRPIIVRKSSAKYNVVVKEPADITAGDGYDVIFTKGDDEGALSAPDAANVNYNGPATLSVYPGYSDAENTYVATVDALQEALEEVVAGTEDKNIVLSGDIDLASLMTRSAVASNWTPIGTEEKPFTGVFDGNGFTIKNLALVEAEAKEGKAYIGFFGYAKNATIKNVTFENVYINIPCLDIDHSQGHIGAVAGSLEGTSTIENVTVKGDIQVYATQEANGASRVAVVAGGNSYGNVTMKNVHVIANEGSYLKANNNTGALAGQLQGKSVFENCSSNIDVTVNKFFAGGLIGLAAGDQTFTNCHTTGDVAVVAGRAGRANDQYRVGGIAGGWADGKDKVCTLTNCSYTGNVSGTNADGSVADPLDYEGYVGRGYTLSNCAGSTVIIDGRKYIQAYDNVYGVYYHVGAIVDVNGAKAIIYSVEDGVKAVSVEELNLNGKNFSTATEWAEGLGEGFHLATMEELDEIWTVRKELNEVLASDNAENALFCETDYLQGNTYAVYLSSTLAEGNDPQGNAYFANRVHLKYFNATGYWDYPYSTMSTINTSAPLKSNYFARAVVEL